jgi:dTDP-4-dehydrorhamnose 3,5-epimerase-like enzyme
MIGKLIDLPKHVDPRGNLTVAEQMKNVPFDIARVYWTYDIPSGERRGGHAHRTCKEVIIAVSGSFDVVLDNGHNSTYWTDTETLKKATMQGTLPPFL